MGKDTKPIEFLGTGTATDAGVTILEKVLNHQCEEVLLEVANTGDTNALTNLSIEIKASKDATYRILANAFTAVTGSLLFFSANLKTLAKETGGIAALRVFGAYSIRVVATTGAAAPTTVTVRGIGYA